MSPGRGAVFTILLGFLLRLPFAALTGLGIDESYMVALSRQWGLSYYDHPPLAWWLTWATIHLTGSEAPLVVRLPFLILFALAGWVMYRLAARLFGPRAGLWAVVLMNLAPVMGVTTASWVLPDGPLLLALLGGALALTNALLGPEPEARRWWLAAGVCAGLALLSKYSAVLCIAGLAGYLVTSRHHRFWLVRWEPWAAAVIALLIFSPALIWNAWHGWASFAFQGGRAAGLRFRPLLSLVTAGGEALYLLPWIWVLTVGVLVAAWRAGPRDEKRWLLAWLGTGPVLLFILISAWSSQRVLFHWGTPGYLLLLPLAGDWLARRRGTWPAVVGWATAALVVVAAGLVTSEVRWGWMPRGWFGPPGRDGAVDQAVDWTSLRDELAVRKQLGPDIVVAATRYIYAGKIDYALGGAVPVLCLGSDPRQYGIEHPVAGQAGKTLLILDPTLTLEQARAVYGNQFTSITAIPPLPVLQDGKPTFEMKGYVAAGFRP